MPPDLGLETERELDTTLEESEVEEPKAKVIIHNDNVTPYDFVIIILQKIFQLSPLAAEHVTYIAHTTGAAHVVTLPLAEARKRVGKAHFAASLEGYPLTFTIETE